MSGKMKGKLKRYVTNPVYATETSQTSSESSLYSAEEIMLKMKAMEICDSSITNPTFTSDIPFSNPEVNSFAGVDMLVINKYYGLHPPDYMKIRVPPTVPAKKKSKEPRSKIPSKSWDDEYPVHSCAVSGNAEMVRSLLVQGYPADEPDRDSWSPLHYACWYGQAEVLDILIKKGKCSPNIENDSGSTPLHFASSRGFPTLVRLLLSHPEIDKTARDSEQKTALQLCEEGKLNQWEETAVILRESLMAPSSKIRVHLVDLEKSHLVLNLLAGNNTTVEQLLQQLTLPAGLQHSFAIWIQSESLQLQMKSWHKPLQHMRMWDSVLEQLTTSRPENERPLLYLRRDAIMTVADEEKIDDPQAIRLLYNECVVNVLKSKYPCSDEDVVYLAAILFQITHGDHDPKKHKSSFFNSLNLRHFVPGHHISSKHGGKKSSGWAHKIFSKHKELTTSVYSKDDKTLQLLYLRRCRQLPVYGSAFFHGYRHLNQSHSKTQQPAKHLIGINSRGVHLINISTKDITMSKNYGEVKWELTNKDDLSFFNSKDGHRIALIKSRQAAIMCNLMEKLSKQFLRP